ncbi:hypothetical protein KY334_07160 [Candidatus Woesearchaeota archaeon]|nr:hypothetical protein [Candidatus Woesearchaeota archaeon]
MLDTKEKIEWIDVSKDENDGFIDFIGIFENEERFKIHWNKRTYKFELTLIGQPDSCGDDKILYFETFIAARDRAEKILNSKGKI